MRATCARPDRNGVLTGLMWADLFGPAQWWHRYRTVTPSAPNKKAARRRLFHEPVETDYFEAALAAEEAASAAEEAADMALEAAESAAEAAGAGAAIGAGAGGVTVVSSFLLHAARATEATRDANRSDFFILVLNQKVEQLPVIVGPLQFHRAPTLKRPRELEHLNGLACHYMRNLVTDRGSTQGRTRWNVAKPHQRAPDSEGCRPPHATPRHGSARDRRASRRRSTARPACSAVP
jgi:hypothetical protein